MKEIVKLLLVTAILTGFVNCGFAQERTPLAPGTVGHPTFMSPQASPIAVSGGRVYVANTPGATVDVINAESKLVEARVNVGIDPVGIAVRPDGKEVWVANHISDSVSVIDADAASPTFLQVIDTVQDFDPKTKATRFDEPVGIAFASNDKVYVALSSENKIAVINVATRQVEKSLDISAQDPRAIVVRGERLYVIPFESNNKTQLSGGTGKLDGDLVTFNAYEHSIRVNNVLSIGHVVDIVKHPKVPDRDLYVFDTRTDTLVKTVDTLGTLLYGLAVDSQGRVFIAQTDARNDANGRAGSKKHGLAELENRAFLNRLTSVRVSGDSAEAPDFFDLEPLPPKHPEKGQALATPFAIQISDDDSTLVVSAAGSDKLFTVDAASGEVLGRAEVGAVPQGIALESSDGGKLARAWVLNAAADTVSLVDVSDVKNPKVVTTIALEDPTHPVVKRGRIAFTTAAASTTGTYSCASCHPDGHTDQLLWVLKTPIVTGGNQIMPRSTMPIRGLRDTEPYHWDGVPGDPYGGINSASIHQSVPANSRVGVPESSTRHLIDGGLAATMSLVGDTTVNDEGKAGALSAAQRDDMAKFLLSVPYPPAQRRSFTNELSSEAKLGFKLFHIDGDLDPSKQKPNVCGDCHRMPFWVSTNTPGTGMDAPTWRGAYDRFLILPQGRLNIIDFDFYQRVAERGIPERSVWQFSWGGRKRFDPIWEMVLEGSTGFSGAYARQVTLSRNSTDRPLTAELLAALELSDREGGIVLQGEGVFLESGKASPVSLQFDAKVKDGTYVDRSGDGKSYTRIELLSLASTGHFVGTFTARLGSKGDVDHPQPAIWTLGPIERQRGRQDFPILHADQKSLSISGRHFGDDARLFVDGRRVEGTVSAKEEKVVITLAALPPIGMHLLQVQVPDGMSSNDLIIHVAKDAAAAAELKGDLIRTSTAPWDGLPVALGKGDLPAVKKLVPDKATANKRMADGSTPLNAVALRGNVEIVKYLLEMGADPSGTNTDGNTPLHAAAFLCHKEVVKTLLAKGASAIAKSDRQETPIDVVSGAWSKELADFYTGLGTAIGIKIDLKQVEQDRPKIAKLLRAQTEKPADVKPVNANAKGELDALGKKFKRDVDDGKMTAEEAMAQYLKAAKKLGVDLSGGSKEKMMTGAANSFYAIVIGRLKTKDIETGEFEMDVDYVTSIYGDARLKETILGKSVKVSGVAGAWLDKLLLIKKGETLKFRSGTLNGTTFSLSPKATVLEQAEPFDPKVYPVPPADFRGFRGVVTGKVVVKSDQGYELTIKVETVNETDKASTAMTPKAIEGRLLDLRGFYDAKYRKAFDDLRVGDTITLGAAHTDTKSDTLEVTDTLEKARK